LDYTFVYPGVNERVADREGNCGNISSAVGPFAVNEGLVDAQGDQATVTIHNTNTRAILRATFPVREGRFYPKGDFAIDGAPDTGSRISIEFLGDPNQPLLPTGQVREKLEIPGFPDSVEVSILRAGNLTVFCTMEVLGIEGDPAVWEKDTEIWQKMEAVRGAAAVRLGMAETLKEAQIKTPAVPKVVAVRKPLTYTDLLGRQQAAESHQFMILTAAFGVMHRAIAVTGSVATAAAAVLPGSVVHDHRRGKGPEVIIGHPSGQISLTADLTEANGYWQAKKIALYRTAREIINGFVFIED
jgi:2-methylaconitate cis-trans-isomerase PrpF